MGSWAGAKHGTTGTPPPRKWGAQGGDRPPGASRQGGIPPATSSAIPFTLRPESPHQPLLMLAAGF